MIFDSRVFKKDKNGFVLDKAIMEVLNKCLKGMLNWDDDYLLFYFNYYLIQKNQNPIVVDAKSEIINDKHVFSVKIFTKKDDWRKLEKTFDVNDKERRKKHLTI